MSEPSKGLVGSACCSSARKPDDDGLRRGVRCVPRPDPRRVATMSRRPRPAANCASNSTPTPSPTGSCGRTDAADGTPHHPARRDQARPPRAASRLRHPRHSEPDTRALTADGTRPFGWVRPPESAPRGRGARTHKAADLVDGRKLWHRRDQRRWLREVYDAADLWARCSPTMPRLRLSTTRTSASSGPRWLPVTLSDKPRALSWSASASTPLAPSGCWQRFRKTPIRRCETLLSGLSTLQGNDNSSTRPPSVIRHHNSERNTGTREGSNRDAHHGGAELCKRSAPPDCATRRAPKVSPSPSASPYSRIHAMARSAATSSDGRSAAGSAPTTARQRRRP